MEAQIVSYRRGRTTQYDNHMIVKVDGVESKQDAEALVGKTVTWTAEGKKNTQIQGKVASAHGNKGAIRVIFERGMPGQSLSSPVSLK